MRREPSGLNRPATGLTIVELLVVTVLTALVLGAVLHFFWLGAHTADATKRLGLLHQLRNSSFTLSQEVGYATDFLFPPADNKPHHQLVFLNRRNEMNVVFLDQNKCLHLFNWTRRCQGKHPFHQVLSQDAISFRVRRLGATLVEFEVLIEEGKTSTGMKARTFAVTNSIRIKNAQH